MDDLVANGFSRKATSPSTDDSNWYLPHHGIYHSCKPGKIRVKFYGTSLNRELFPGPDLTSQLVGVLTRFRTEVTFMADNQAMFHHVHIPEKERSFLSYLWWEDVNLEKLIDYEMCIHVFGGISSPGCCNYAFQITALGNVSSYSKETTNTLLRNFYVHDVLKSVPPVRDVIQEVRDLCKKGGFKLTKFISNKKDILFQIPDAFRRDGTKDMDLTGSLPIERALRIFWGAKNDVIKFKIDLKDQPMTRRGMLSVISSIYDALGLACPFLLQGRSLLQDLCQVMHG